MPRIARLRDRPVFDSLDAGRSWNLRAESELPPTPLNLPPLPQNLPTMLYDRHDPDAMILFWSFEPRPVQVTQDGGRSWLTVPSCRGCASALLGSNGTMWALGWTTSAGELFRSTDRGVTFVVTATYPLAYSPMIVGARADQEILELATRGELVELDLRSFRWEKQKLPLEKETAEKHEQVGAATLVPGAPGVVCLGIDAEASFVLPPGFQSGGATVPGGVHRGDERLIERE